MSDEDMKIDPSRAHALRAALSSVSSRIEAVAAGRNVCQLIPFPALPCPHLYIKKYGIDRRGREEAD